MAEKEKQSEHKSTIDKYFDRTAKAYKTWVEENEEERNFLQIAAEDNGDISEEGGKGFDFHIAYHGSTNFLASGIAQTMEKDGFLRHLIIEAARKFLMKTFRQ